MFPTPLVIRGMSKKEKGSTPKIALNLEKPSLTITTHLKTNASSTCCNVINTFYL
jgi:hypothetical protein